MDGAPRKKTVLAPCMGVGKIVANVTRRAAYQIKDQCPDDVELLSIPALLAGDPHERALIQDNPTIIIDGCALRCAAHIFRHLGVEAVAKIEVNQVMKEEKIGPGKTRKELEATGKRLSEFTADRVLRALRDDGLDAVFSPLDELAQPVPEFSCACPLAEKKTAPEATESAAVTTNRVPAVSVMPCQGIKRSGGRITQRAAYQVVEDRFLGRSQVVCISALAAGVQEDIDMVERFPTLAVNGCGLNCASKAAEHFGVAAVRSVNLQDVSPEYDGAGYCLEADLTQNEIDQADKLAAVVATEVEALLAAETTWNPPKVDLHGLVVEPAKINALTGYANNGQGILVQLAKRQISADAVPVAVRDEKKEHAEVAAAKAVCQSDFPGLRNVTASLFAPKAAASKSGVNTKPGAASE